jgi:hypothetical protein
MSGQRGQVTVLLALAMVAALLVSGVAVDGGYGFVQWRQAQNAADLGSEAAVQALEPACFGTDTVLNQQVSAAIDDVVGTDAPQAAGRWSGVYLDQSGSPLSGAPALPAGSGSVPAGACGVSVQVTPSWTPFLMQLLGFNTLSATARAGAVVGNNPSDAPAGSGDTNPSGADHSVGIVALAATGKHTIWSGGSGQFVINGDILDNSTGSPGSYGYADTVDSFQSSSIVVHGQLQSVAAEPLDPCFYPAGPTEATCSEHDSQYIEYDGGMYGGLPAEPDPLAFVPAPTQSDAACPPGGTPTVYSSAPTSGTLAPGVYTSQVTLTGTTTLQDCGGQPGLYDFENGVAICPGSGATVTGSDITLYSTASRVSLAACGSGKVGNHDAIHIGGQGSVSLTGPSSGTFAHMLLYQDRGVSANIGLDDQTGDAGTIQLTGAIYDNSQGGLGILACGGQPGGGAGGGTITVDGVAVVDQFDTGGTADVTITYDASQLPGVGPVLVQ